MIESYELRMRAEDDIICPYCKHAQDNNTMYHYVTAWGDDGNHKECDCESCGKTFWVKEFVSRSFSTYKKEEEITHG